MPYNKNLYINKWLLPFSWLYGLVVSLRAKLFDLGVLKQEKYDIPIICVGNITVGGTGKTPHVEYLVNLLKSHYKVAVLSRGYKRKSKGFVMAHHDSTASQIGDEPLQIKAKFPDIIVAVDSDRRRGINHLLDLEPSRRPDIILLDDAYQHRYVKPSYSILLTDFNRLMVFDKLLPAGRLREPVHNADRANIILVTKCPPDITPLDQRIGLKDLHVYPYQCVFYTTFKYGDLKPVFDDVTDNISVSKLKEKEVLIVTGIANPQPMYDYIKKHAKRYETIEYPDHYQFKNKDLQKIKSVFNNIQTTEKIIVVTEKDAVRLMQMKDVDPDLKKYMYYLPIEVSFVNKNEKEIFNSKVLEHVS